MGGWDLPPHGKRIEKVSGEKERENTRKYRKNG